MLGLNPKDIILKQLQEHFQQAGYKEVMFIYTSLTGLTTAKGLTTDNKNEPLEVEKTENNLIRSVLVKQIKNGLKFEFSHLIVSINIEEKTISMFAKNLAGELIPIEL